MTVIVRPIEAIEALAVLKHINMEIMLIKTCDLNNKY